MTREFILLKVVFALALFYMNGDDFLFETALFLSFLRFHLALIGELIAFFAADVELFGNVLCGHAHVIAVEGIGETIADHGVLKGARIHAIAETSLVEQVRGGGHVFHATDDHDFGVAVIDHGGRHIEGLEAGAAEVIQCRSGHLIGETGISGRLTGRILAEAGLDDVAEEHFVNLFGFDPGAFQGFPNDNFTELDGGNVGERAAKFANSCAAGAEDSDIVLHKLFLSCRAFVSAASWLKLYYSKLLKRTPLGDFISSCNRRSPDLTYGRACPRAPSCAG